MPNRFTNLLVFWFKVRTTSCTAYNWHGKVLLNQIYVDYLLEQVWAHKPAAADYIANIDDCWRSTDWISYERQIPPRYGIVTSNTSECVNNMFGKAQSLGWLECIDKLVDIMTNSQNLSVLHKVHGQGLYSYRAKSGRAPTCTMGCCCVPHSDGVGAWMRWLQSGGDVVSSSRTSKTMKVMTG